MRARPPARRFPGAARVAALAEGTAGGVRSQAELDELCPDQTGETEDAKAGRWRTAVMRA